MKLHELILEYNSNPFVAIVSSIDLKIKEIDLMISSNSTSLIFLSSMEQQLMNLKKFIISSKNWNIPENNLKKDFHNMIPIVLNQIKLAIEKINEKSFNNAKIHLLNSMNIAIKYSNLKFGDINE